MLYVSQLLHVSLSSISNTKATLASHVLVVFFVVVSLIWKRMGTLMVYKNLKMCCFWFTTYKKLFIIYDPELRKSILVLWNYLKMSFGIVYVCASSYTSYIMYGFEVTIVISGLKKGHIIILGHKHCWQIEKAI